MDKPLRYLALAAKSGAWVSGSDSCEKYIRSGKKGTLILAADASEPTKKTFSRLAQSFGLPVYNTACTKNLLAHATGRATPISVGVVTNNGLAQAFLSASDALNTEEE